MTQMKWKPIIFITANRLATYSAEHENQYLHSSELLQAKANEQKDDVFGQHSFPGKLLS